MPSVSDVDNSEVRSQIPNPSASRERSEFYWTAARLYLRDRHQSWVDHGSRVESNDRVQPIFPRLYVLDTIAVEVDRLDPTHLPSADQVLEWLELCGDAAQGIFAGTYEPGSVEDVAEQEERAKFLRFCTELSTRATRDLERLPYRRMLGDVEAEQLGERAQVTWGLDYLAFWEPLKHNIVRGERTLVLRNGAFEKTGEDDGPANLAVRRALTNLGVTRIFELREYGPAFERAPEATEFVYNGAEGFFFSKDLAWIVFASHESVTTMGGTVVTELEQSWDDLESHVWNRDDPPWGPS